MNQLRRLHVTFPGQADQLAWLGRLVGAPTPQAVGELVVELARNSVACRDARLLWLEQDECRATDGCPDARARAWMLPLLRGEHGGAAPLGGAHAIRLAPDLPALLLMMPDGEVADGWPGTALEPCLGLAGRQLRQLLALGELHDSHRQLARSENLQRALFAISDLAGADLDMISAVRFIHRVVGLDLDEALRMASLYPAQAVGQSSRHGRLGAGAAADIVSLSDDLDVRRVWIGGAPVWGHIDREVAAGRDRDEVIGEITQRIPIGIIPPEEDCAKAVLFMVSDYSKVVSGASLDVNGGQYMAP